MKQTVILIAALFAAGAIYAQQPNTLSNKEKKDGWVLLFDGHTTKGWHTYLKDTVGSKWQVKDGAIVFDPSQPKEGGRRYCNQWRFRKL